MATVGSSKRHLNITSDSSAAASTMTLGGNGVATEAYVGTQITNLIDSSPSALNTLNELAAALGDDASFSTTVTNSIATKLPLAGGTLTGTLTGTYGIFGNQLYVNQGANLTSQALQVNGFIDITDVTGTALRWYNGSTFRGGLGTNAWAMSGSDSDLAMYIAGNNSFFIQTNNVTRAEFDSNGLEVTGNITVGNITKGSAGFITIGDDSNIVSIGQTNEMNFMTDVNSDQTIYFNHRGYNDASTRFRSLEIRNGKGSAIANFNGVNKATTLSGTLAATNFSGSSSGTNTGDQTLPTLSSLGALSASGTAFSLSGNDVAVGESITLAGGLSYSGTTLTSANDNTTYTAGTGLTLTGTSFSVTANTYATAAQGTNADTAHGWGNHASAGYVTSSGNTIIGTDSDINTSGSTIIDNIYVTDGVITSMGTRTLTPADIGAVYYDHIHSLGVPAFTNGSNPNITTAQVMSEIESDGGFDSYTSVFKTSWSYAGNYNLTDAGNFTETAGSSWITWTDNSSDSTRGNITALAIAPTTGGSAGGVFIYNDQSSGYSPGWREVWTSSKFADNSGNWNTAYGWGDHAGAGYQTAQRAISSTPTDGATTTAISSDWAFDNVKTAVPTNAVFTDTVNSFDGAYSSLTGKPTIPSGNAIIDWTTDQGSTNINSGNYTNTTYTAGTGLTLTGTAFSVTANTYAAAAHDHSRIVERPTITYGSGQLQWTDLSGTGGTGLNGAAPGNPFSDWFHHIIMNHANSSGYYVDLAACFHSDDLYFRRNVGGTLSTWREIYHTGNLTPLTIGTTATTAMAGNTTIPSGNAVIDWTVDNDNIVIHSGNYTDTDTWVANSATAAGYVASGAGMSNKVWKTDANGNPGWDTDRDTVYTHPTSAGNKHIPTGGSAGQFLKYSSSGTATWATPSYTTNTDTQLSSTDVIGMFTAGTNVAIASDGTISSTDTDTVYTHPTSAGNKHIPTGGSAGQFLKYSASGTATWATPSYTTNTDTVYTHPTSAGNKHIPTGGSAGQFLKYSASGTATWATPSYTTNTDNQLSQTDVIGMFTAGNNITIGSDGTIDSTDTDTVYTHPTSAGNKHIPTGGSAGQFLKYSASGTATWATPSYTTNTNTTYSAGTGMTLNGTVFNCDINSPADVALANLSSSGNALAGAFTATGDITAFSDARVKENVETIPNALEKVTALRGVNFNKIGEEKRSTGVIAQEVREVLPEVIHENEDGMLSVAYGNITGVLIEAIKEQQKQIDELKARLNGLTK